MNSFYRFLFLLIIAVNVFMLLIAGSAKAQDVSSFSQYMYNMAHYNPAYCGSLPFMKVNLTHHNQWQDVQGAPEATMLSMQAPINFTRVGLGLIAYNQKGGIETNNTLFLNYAYHIPIGPEGHLSFGLGAGISNRQVRWSQVITYDPENPSTIDPAIPSSDVSVWMPNVGVGLYYHTSKFSISLSAPRIFQDSPPTSSAIKDNINLSGKDIMMFLVCQYSISINNNIKLQPSLLIHSSPNSSPGTRVRVNSLWVSGLSLGTGYNSNNSITTMVGYHFSPKLQFYYSYDTSTTKSSAGGKNSHEIILNYNLSLRKNQITSPRYF